MRYAVFNGFDLGIKLEDALSCCHPGPCDADVLELLEDEGITAQLDSIGADKIRDELWEYGAWDDDQLSRVAENRMRIVWIACGNICEEEGANMRHDNATVSV